MAASQATLLSPVQQEPSYKGRLGTHGMGVGGLRCQNPIWVNWQETWVCGSVPSAGLNIRTIIETQRYCAQLRFLGQFQTLPAGSAVDGTKVHITKNPYWRCGNQGEPWSTAIV